MNHVIWSPGMSLEVIERQVIEAALGHFRSKAATASALGIAVRTLDNKLEKYLADDQAEKVAEESRRQAMEVLLQRSRGIDVPPAQEPVAEEDDLSDLIGEAPSAAPQSRVAAAPKARDLQDVLRREARGR